MTEDAAQQRRRIDIVSDPEFLARLETMEMTELREMRVMCDALDRELSYYRRLLHGRMDLLSFEMRRRSGEETRSLIEALPEILAGSEAGPPRETNAKPILIEAPDLPSEGKRLVDRALGDDFLARLPSTDDAELEVIQRLLTDVEGDVSQQRRTVYESYEKIHAELTRRYREGLANVDELLGSL